MRVDLNPCYILHHRSYREIRLLLDVFSKDHGRVNLIARGIKKNSKENKQAILQPYQRLLLAWSGKSELATLTKMEIESVRLDTTTNAMLCGFYLNELLVRLLHKHEPHLQLFENYQHALDNLNHGRQTEFTLRLFEKALLDELGYGLTLDCDVETGDDIKTKTDYFYSIEQGASVQFVTLGDALKVSGETLIALREGVFDSERSLKEAKKLMRFLLKPLLGNKPLASRELFLQHKPVKS